MPTDLALRMEDQPGALAALGVALGNAGVNIDGICAVTRAGQGEVHVLVEDASKARTALEGADIEILGVTEPVLVGFEDRPGELGEVASRMAGAGVNIEVIYVSCDNRLVLVTSDQTAALQAL